MQRPFTLIILVVLAGSAWFIAAAARPGSAQQVSPTVVVGRYQAVLGGGTPAPCVVIDTTTGQCWLKSATGWDSLGTPISPKK